MKKLYVILIALLATAPIFAQQYGKSSNDAYAQKNEPYYSSNHENGNNPRSHRDDNFGRQTTSNQYGHTMQNSRERQAFDDRYNRSYDSRRSAPYPTYDRRYSRAPESHQTSSFGKGAVVGAVVGLLAGVILSR